MSDTKKLSDCHADLHQWEAGDAAAALEARVEALESELFCSPAHPAPSAPVAGCHDHLLSEIRALKSELETLTNGGVPGGLPVRKADGSSRPVAEASEEPRATAERDAESPRAGSTPASPFTPAAASGEEHAVPHDEERGDSRNTAIAPALSDPPPVIDRDLSAPPSPVGWGDDKADDANADMDELRGNESDEEARAYLTPPAPERSETGKRWWCCERQIEVVPAADLDAANRTIRSDRIRFDHLATDLDAARYALELTVAARDKAESDLAAERDAKEEWMVLAGNERTRAIKAEADLDALREKVKEAEQALAAAVIKADNDCEQADAERDAALEREKALKELLGDLWENITDSLLPDQINPDSRWAQWAPEYLKRIDAALSAQTGGGK